MPTFPSPSILSSPSPLRSLRNLHPAALLLAALPLHMAAAINLSLPMGDPATTLSSSAGTAIDRTDLVSRNSPTILKLDPLAPLAIGNGEFAFTADVTGLQTFPEAYDTGIPLHTQSQWGWHSFPNTNGYKPADAMESFQIGNRKVDYIGGQNSPAGKWLRANPHRLDLGRIGLIIKRPGDGQPAQASDIQNIRQTLNLWTGMLDSRFTVEGVPVHVQTTCHPTRDQIAARIESPLLKDGRLGVLIAFPGGSEDWKQTADWSKPDSHLTDTRLSGNSCRFFRTLDASKYFVAAEWSSGGMLRPAGAQRYELFAPGEDRLDIAVDFARDLAAAGQELPTFTETQAASAAHWERFWTDGAAVDFFGSTDPRARELERRVVLSQYLTAINCAGSMPPQETGLAFNSWFGKFHLEMHWWHAAQFALWNRPQLLEKSLAWYQAILPAARANAKRQGYLGVRWPKMVGPDGQDSPSKVAPFLIWQQPHPIYLAELLYRAQPDDRTLSKYEQIVSETASFMASYAARDEKSGRYVLGPAMIPAQECYSNDAINPTFELAYWWWALDIAQQWRVRQGLKRDTRWDEIMANLSKPTVKDGAYAAIENPPFTKTNDHPSMLGALGMLPPTPLIDKDTMNRTLESVLKTWEWPSTWGWDYPLIAMTAARLGRPDDAVDALLMDAQKNTYLPNGHNYQDERLPIYLPGNGGLLAAVAMMAGGWDGAPTKDAPGFPKNGKWRIRSEGLKPMP